MKMLTLNYIFCQENTLHGNSRVGQVIMSYIRIVYVAEGAYVNHVVEKAVRYSPYSSGGEGREASA